MRSYYNNEIDIGKGVMSRIPECVQGGKTIVIIEQAAYQTLAPVLKNVSHVPHLIGHGNHLDIAALLKEPCDAYMGVGGGTAIDIGKYLGFVKKKPVIALPSILSTNAFTTVKVCCKEVLRYTGGQGSVDGKIPEVTLVDLELIDKAEKRCNRSGVGDILSIHIANWEWKIAKKDRKLLPYFKFKDDPYDPVLGNLALSLLQSLHDELEEIHNATEEGLRALVKLLIYSGYVTNMYGSGRPESGAEHLFASAVVHTYPERHFLHGELVSLGTLLMTRLQERDVAYVADMIRGVGLPTSLEIIGLTVDETVRVLSIAKEERHDRYTTLHHKHIGLEESKAAVNFLMSHRYLSP